ncbi:alpha keto acid dehydrogenase complex, E2 component, dihydrolipoamide acetyltransferase [Plesiocystis pacifica SIR-1]|uniref:Dihydrolipoamide acetyltransferase component of pyruvate dehydrogenase complex n=1 Tax=Plesiocystis pacifica SIR-1 TaxID=391625 RepID=A6GB59_9BACT|nr:dihydrolipoamide acetyltransferase family protein [Plesiocystis pacifica]EDM76941.1 alpha keto acid dehydrogenase complex, E2 component, dihydrolipoamide acetyltransferase [Plesiocystis pacifica SIR-1]
MVEFKLPEIGEGVIEGEIVQWLIAPGNSFATNDGLVEVMTDKATIEIPAPFDGVLREQRAAEGDVCAVGSVIAILEEGAAASPEAPAPAAAAPATPAAPAPATPAPTPTDSSILATPAARALAREHDIDLARVPVDESGRITKSDVAAIHERGGLPPAAAPAAASAPARAPVAAAPAPAPAAKPAPAPAPAPVARPSVGPREDEYIPFRGMRRRIAEGMVKSYTEAVHYTYVEQIDVTKLVTLRKQAKKAAAEQGVSLSYLPFIIKAVCHALKRFPIVNAELDEAQKRIVLKKRYSIGVAAATDQGLMVPVIHDADMLSLLDLAREVKRLGEGAKTGRLARDELTGSTFTITSLGTIGGVLATPILNYPEVGILGVHAIRKVPVVNDNDEIVIGHIMNLSVSLDHRVVDGFEGASFLQEVRRYLEDPTLLLLAGI